MQYLIIARIDEGHGERLHLEFLNGSITAEQARAQFLDRMRRYGTFIAELAVLSGPALTIECPPARPAARPRSDLAAAMTPRINTDVLDVMEALTDVLIDHQVARPIGMAAMLSLVFCELIALYDNPRNRPSVKHEMRRIAAVLIEALGALTADEIRAVLRTHR